MPIRVLGDLTGAILTLGFWLIIAGIVLIGLGFDPIALIESFVIEQLGQRLWPF